MQDHPAANLPPAPDRPADAHKGTFGTVVVIGGSATMIGAPALAANSALRVGCGLAKIMTDPAVLAHCLTVEPSATGVHVPRVDDPNIVQRAVESLGGKRNVLAVGPGMGVAPGSRAVVERITRQTWPVVLDADGLNNLAQLAEAVDGFAGPAVLTPHPGEFARLAEAAGIEQDPTDPEQRPEAAAALARRYDAVVALKGRHTVIGDGDRRAINETGNPALATAGSGDVLTGAIAGLLAQGMEPFEAATLGCHLHGRAADLWTEANHPHPAGLKAHELADWLPKALSEHANK